MGLVCLDAHLSNSIWEHQVQFGIQKVTQQSLALTSRIQVTGAYTIRVFLVLSGTAVQFTGTLHQISHMYKNSIVFFTIKRFKILRHFYIMLKFKEFSDLKSCLSIIALKTHFSTLHTKCTCGCNCSFWPCYFPVMSINSELNTLFYYQC